MHYIHTPQPILNYSLLYFLCVQVLGLSFSLAVKNAPFPKTKFGVFRM